MDQLFIIKVNILVLIKLLFRSPPPPPAPIMLTIEFSLIIIFYARSPITLNYISFIYPFLQPHLITYRSKIGVQLR